MELAGRQDELAALDAAVAAARAGDCRVVVIAGESGIGKSALAAAAAERAAAAGMRVIAARAAEHERDVPFGLVVEAFDDVVADLHPRRRAGLEPTLGGVLPAAGDGAGAAADPAERFRAHRALRRLVEELARERPLALVLDDVHWADPASEELVLHLLHRPPRAGCLLVLALRPGEAAGARVLDAARRAEGCDVLGLGPLERDAALALVGELPDAAARERVVAEAGGHPLFLRELARAARDPGDALPPTVVAAVARERERLDPEARALVDGAAVAGDPFDPELAACAAALAPAAALGALDRLVAADLARPGGDGRQFAFRHPLVRRAVYDAAPPAWRLGAHERVAAALEARGAPATARAYHVARCARPGDEAALALLQAAAAESAGQAPETAVRWLRTALRLLPVDDVARRAALLGPLASAQADAGRLQESRATLLEALAIAPDEPALVAACAAVEQLLGRHADAARRLHAGLGHAAPADRPGFELELALAAFYATDADAVLRHAAPAAAAAGQPEALVLTATALEGMARLWRGEPAAADRLLDDAGARLAALDDDGLAARTDAALILGAAETLAERFAPSLATLTRGLDVARRRRQNGLIPLLLAMRGMMRVNLLDLDGALADLEAAEDAARPLGLAYAEAWALSSLAGVHHERGAPAERARAVAACERLLPLLEASNVTVTARCNLAALWGDQDPERCLREMTAAGGDGLERADPTWSTSLLRTLVRAALALGRVDDAARWAALAAERSRARALPAGAGRAAAAGAEVLLARGAPIEAVAAAEEAVERAVAAGCRYDEVDHHIVLGRALAAAGRRAEAVAALEAAMAAAAATHAQRFRDAAAAELRAIGVRVAAPSRRAQAGELLSAREREIVALVAGGATNRQVGAALHLSEKTIESHLSRVYEKLGVRSRVELAGRLAAGPR